MKKKILLLTLTLFISLLCFSKKISAQRQTTDTDCNSTVICPAPPGECVGINEWVGEWTTYPVEVNRCVYSNNYCDSNADCEDDWSVDDPYAPGAKFSDYEKDSCQVFYQDEPVCDSTLWTSCCSPGGDPTPQPATPTDNPNPTSNPTPTMTNLSGAFFLTGEIDPDASAFSCTQPADTSSLILPSGTVTAYLASNNSQVNFVNISNSGTYVIPLRTGQAHNIYLTIPNSSNYVCSCPASVAGDQKRCAYFDITATSGDEGLNFYLMDASISNASWFQFFDGGAYALNSIQSIIPYLACDLTASCDSAIFTEQNNNLLSIGFPSLQNSDSANVKSSTVIGSNLNYIHTSDRSTNNDSYIIKQRMNQYGYTQLLQMAETSGASVTTLSAGEVNLSTLRSGGQLSSANNFFLIEGDLSINETNQLAANSGENVTFFVNGNLNISDDGDDESKITQVASKTTGTTGGFLAFIVSGNINIDGTVGNHLDPVTPNLPVVSIANSQLEGVFLADGTLTIASSGSYPDHKFIGAGTFVGWDGVNLNRQVEDPNDDTDNSNRVLNNNQALDNFIYRSDLLSNWPVELKTSLINWREVSPQQISQ